MLAAVKPGVVAVTQSAIALLPDMVRVVLHLKQRVLLDHPGHFGAHIGPQQRGRKGGVVGGGEFVTHIVDQGSDDHVGIGADWDGGGGVIGMEDAASLPKITERLVKAGYTEEQLGNFWSGNALRVLGKAQAARKPA